MAIKTMSVSSGGGQWTEGWHTLTISKAEYGDWNGTRVLDLYFEDYPETFNHRIFEAFDKETHEEYSLAKFFKLCNAGLIDKIKSPSGKEAIQYDDDESGLVGKQFNALFYKDANDYNKICNRIAPVEQTGTVVSYSAEDVNFWKGVAEKYLNEKVQSAPSQPASTDTVTAEDVPF